MKKICIFDLDGTLIDSLQDLAVAGNVLMEKLGYPTHPVESYKQFVGSGIKNLILRATSGISWTEEDLMKAVADYMEYYSEHCSIYTTIYPGIMEVLDTLKAMGFELAVVTNKPDTVAKKIVKDLFGERFSYVYGQVDHIPVKPNPTLVYQILNKANIQKDFAFYIGDSDVDIYTALNASITPIGCLWGNRTKEELLKAGATLLATKAEDIIEMVRDK